MKIFNYKPLSLFLIVCSLQSGAQELLTLKAAIDTALYNNLGLVISRNEASILDNNASRANAGMLPRIDVNAGANYSNNSLNQKFNTGVEIDKTGVENKSYNGQLALNWTLFDGTKMFATYEKLQILKDMGELRVQIKTEEIIYNIVTVYSDVVRQKIILQGLINNMALYEERYKLADIKLKIGKSSRSELLQASIDLNNQKNNLLKQNTLLKSTKLTLGKWMMYSPERQFDVADSLELNEKILLKDVLDPLEAGNKQLQLLRMEEKQRTQEVKEQQSFAYPRVNLNAGYNFTSNSSTQGLFLVNQSRGPLVGLTFNWNLYNGTQRKQVENLKLQQQNTTLVYEDTKLSLQTMVTNAWQRYYDAIDIAVLEKVNYKLALENLNITMQRFKLNEATLLELKDAQQINEASVTRLANTLFDAKTAEAELLFLSGKLIQ